MPPLARFSTSFTIIIFILLKETDLGRSSLSKVIQLGLNHQVRLALVGVRSSSKAVPLIQRRGWWQGRACGAAH